MSQPLSKVVRDELMRAGRYLKQGRLEAAERLCLDLLAAAPGLLDAHYMLAVAREARGDRPAALAACDAALAISPDYLRARLQKAQILMGLGNRVEAVAEAEIAADRQPKDAFSLNAIAVTFTRGGSHERAVEFYQRAVQAGGAPAHYFNLAVGLETLGSLDAARAAYRACLKRDPDHAPAWLGLVQITRQTAESNEIEPLEKAFAKASGHPALRHDLGHALAKAWEDVDEPLKAMHWLSEAKAGMCKISGHAPEKDSALFAAAENALVGAAGEGASDLAPIFVVGLPRTGTTLVERILTSHSAVSAAGELPDFPEAIRSIANLPGGELFSTDIVSASRDVDAARVGERYALALEQRLGLTDRFVDKLPVNFFLVPAILRALPNARVVCVRRHPADAMLANYRQIFARGARYLDYTLDLGWTARYVAMFERLATRWREALPPERYCEVHYERVVQGIESEARRLLEFSGLGFERACIEFHKNAAPIATASAAQVRQPLYTSSVGKWRRYRPAIDEGLAILAEEGVIPEPGSDS